MLNFSSDNFISLPIKNDIGLKTGFFINQNFKNKISCFLYKFTELYDKFAFNNYELYSILTFKRNRLVLKPKIIFSLKNYLEIATPSPYEEYKGIIELEINLSISEHIEIFTLSFLELANSNNENEYSYLLSFGTKYKF